MGKEEDRRERKKRGGEGRYRPPPFAKSWIPVHAFALPDCGLTCDELIL